MGNEIQNFDAATAERIKALMALSDARPSSDGFGGVTVYELGKMGGWVNTKEKERGERRGLRVIPLVLRETRAYWARKGTGDAPDCRSINGLVPVTGPDVEAQHETCTACPWNKFGTAEGGGKGKKCKTKGVLFAMEANEAGAFIGPVVLRFSMGNRGVSGAILGADRSAAAMGLPRFLTVWDCKTAVGHGAQDYIFFAPECVAKVDVSKASEILDLVEKIGKEQADQFLSAATAAESE